MASKVHHTLQVPQNNTLSLPTVYTSCPKAKESLVWAVKELQKSGTVFGEGLKEFAFYATCKDKLTPDFIMRLSLIACLKHEKAPEFFAQNENLQQLKQKVEAAVKTNAKFLLQLIQEEKKYQNDTELDCAKAFAKVVSSTRLPPEMIDTLKEIIIRKCFESDDVILARIKKMIVDGKLSEAEEEIGHINKTKIKKVAARSLCEKLEAERQYDGVIRVVLAHIPSKDCARWLCKYQIPTHTRERWIKEKMAAKAHEHAFDIAIGLPDKEKEERTNALWGALECVFKRNGDFTTVSTMIEGIPKDHNEDRLYCSQALAALKMVHKMKRDLEWIKYNLSNLPASVQIDVVTFCTEIGQQFVLATNAPESKDEKKSQADL